MKHTLLSLAIVTLLTACGGGSSSDGQSTNNNGNPNTPTTPSTTNKIGILTDAVISGVHYVSKNSQGVVSYEGTTGDASSTNGKGSFKYNEGDKVTFSIGDIVLGSVTAQVKISPLELATDPVIRNNLIILLQSLDADQNHSNGIEISTKTVEALKDKTIVLNTPTASFIADATFLQAVKASGTAVVPSETALANFIDSFAKDNEGVWSYSNNGTRVLLYIKGAVETVNKDKYLHFIFAQVGPADNDGQSGFEQGKFKWDPLTGKLTVVSPLTQDTNGGWGLSDSSQPFSLLYGKTEGTLQLLTEDPTPVVLTKLPSESNSIVGAWKNADALVAMYNDKTYLYVGLSNEDCGGPGIEYGTYSASNGILKAESVQYDTTGCLGLVDTWGDLSQHKYDLDTFKYSLNDKTINIQYEDEPVSTLSHL
ncbi:hypothetical protein D7V68_13920 [Acinetobacter cumulans]|uniref:hypothetical protein n=1 Tax=Acinetobacter cumulans TaxID=2136182 RepID=UPI000EA2E52D|nr:hypothetical protein [Acinetobacter cumulans]RKG46548.1 hypothetical protein D7V68_13920 [Acinetobacter cumulans]